MMSYKYERNFMKTMRRNKRCAEWLELKSQCLNHLALAGLKSIVLAGKLHLISDSKPIKSRLIRKYIVKVFNLAEYSKIAQNTSHSFIKALLFTMNRFNERVKKQNAPRFRKVKEMFTNAQ